jgi:ribosomal protein L11 methyltransferase
MCLELLEEAFEQFGARNDRGPRTVDRQLSAVNRRPSAIRRQPAVLDLGTGSGLLAIAALRFGAGRVLALDTDTVACRTASENIRRNGGDGRIIVKHGSLEAAGRRTHDVVLANLTAEQLISLAPRLTRSLRSKGRLIASGILRHQERRVAETFRGCGLVVERVRRGREWVGLMSRRASASPRGAR